MSSLCTFTAMSFENKPEAFLFSFSPACERIFISKQISKFVFYAQSASVVISGRRIFIKSIDSRCARWCLQAHPCTFHLKNCTGCNIEGVICMLPERWCDPVVAAFRSQQQGKKEAMAEKKKKENGSANTSGEGQVEEGAEDKEGSEDDVTYQGEEKEDYIITVNEDVGDDDVEEIEDSWMMSWTLHVCVCVRERERGGEIEWLRESCGVRGGKERVCVRDIHYTERERKGVSKVKRGWLRNTKGEREYTGKVEQERRGGVGKARERDCMFDKWESDGACVTKMGIHWEAVQERWCRERLVTGETEKEREAAYGKYPRKLRRTVERERVYKYKWCARDRQHERKGIR